MKKVISGFTCDTPERLLLNAGAWFKNFNVISDTFDSAVTAGKLLGATQGGGTFTATPTTRNIDVDGVKSVGKGLIVIDGWVVTMQANVIEISAQMFKDALGAGDLDTASNSNFDVVRAKNYIDDEDYIDNITWLGTLSGSDDPVIIQIFNVLSTSGVSLQTQDKNQAALSVTFTATQDMCGPNGSIDYAPFAIYYPKSIAKPKITPVKASDTTVAGTGISGAAVSVYGGTIPADANATVVAGGTWSVTIPKQSAGTVVYAKQTVNGKSSLPEKVIVTAT